MIFSLEDVTSHFKDLRKTFSTSETTESTITGPLSFSKFGVPCIMIDTG